MVDFDVARSYTPSRTTVSGPPRKPRRADVRGYDMYALCNAAALARFMQWGCRLLREPPVLWLPDIPHASRNAHKMAFPLA
jgi:hypothetical protein